MFEKEYIKKIEDLFLGKNLLKNKEVLKVLEESLDYLNPEESEEDKKEYEDWKEWNLEQIKNSNFSNWYNTEENYSIFHLESVISIKINLNSVEIEEIMQFSG